MGTIHVSQNVLMKLLTSVEALQGEVSDLRLQTPSYNKSSMDLTDTIWVVNFDCDHAGIVWKPGKALFPFINSLPNSVNTLQTEVAQLWEEREQYKLEIENIRRETTALKLSISSNSTRSDEVFTLFPKLAKELQRLIWDTFLEIPQVVGVRLVTVEWLGKRLAGPIGQHSVLRQVNKESRHGAKRFQSSSIAQTISISAPKIFFDPHIDTLWLANRRMREIQIGHKYGIFCEAQRIEKLALPAEMFLHGLRYHNDKEVFEIFFTLWKMRSSGIDLVVGNNHVSRDSNVKFIPPRGGPLEYFAGMWVGGSVKKVEERNSIHQWARMLESFTKNFREVLEWQRTQRGILKGEEATEDDSLEVRFIREYVNETWSIPSFCFVEATSALQQ